MGVNVGNKKSEHVTISLTNGGTKLSVDGGGPSGAVGIGATNKVGAKSVETQNGGSITELRDTIGGTLSASDIDAIFDRLTNSDGKGAPQGIDGVTLIGLTSDSFTIAIDNGFAVDTITFDNVGSILDKFDTGGDLGDQKSRFSVIEVGEETVIGTKGGGFGDLVGGSLAGEADAAAALQAAISGDERVKLVGLESDNFAVQFNGKQGTTDTILFTGAEDAVSSVVKSAINAGNKGSEAVIVTEDTTGTIGIGGGKLGAAFIDDDGGNLGGVLSVSDAIIAAQTAGVRPNVNAIDQGGTVRLEVTTPNGPIDYVVIDDIEADYLSGGSFNIDLFVA